VVEGLRCRSNRMHVDVAVQVGSGLADGRWEDTQGHADPDGDGELEGCSYQSGRRFDRDSWADCWTRLSLACRNRWKGLCHLLSQNKVAKMPSSTATHGQDGALIRLTGVNRIHTLAAGSVPKALPGRPVLNCCRIAAHRWSHEIVSDLESKPPKCPGLVAGA
jgi:hypothetical protein